MQTTKLSSTSTASSKRTAPDHTNNPSSEQATPWSFYFLMAMLGIGLLLMLGLALFSF